MRELYYDLGITGASLKSVKQSLFGRLSKKQSGRGSKAKPLGLKSSYKKNSSSNYAGQSRSDSPLVPPEWEPLLVSAGITPKEIAENQSVRIYLVLSLMP